MAVNDSLRDKRKAANISVLSERPPNAYVTALREHLLAHLVERNDQNGPEPAWLSSQRKAGLKRFDELGFPHHKLEAWKYIDLRPISQTIFTPYPLDINSQNRVSADVLSALSAHKVAESEGLCLVFVNGRHFPDASTLTARDVLPKDVLIATLKDALATQPDRLQPDLIQTSDEETDAFAALNMAHFEDGPVIAIPDGIQLDRPVQIIFYQTRDNAVPRSAYSRGLLHIGRSAHVSVAVQFLGSPNPSEHPLPYLNNTVLQVVAEEDATLDLTLLQMESDNAYGFLATQIQLGKNSRVSMTSVTLKGRMCRHHVDVSLIGEGATCTLNGLSVLRNDSQAYHHTVIRHQAPKCTSRQVYKGILDHRSRHEFDGTIIVHRNAQQTDSSQLNKNLLLSDDTHAYTRPQLKIDADNVKCSHGATVSQLDENELFYLASRGLSPSVARCLLTFGFAEDIVRRIPHTGYQAYINPYILENLGQSNNPLNCFATCDHCPTSPPAAPYSS